MTGDIIEAIEGTVRRVSLRKSTEEEKKGILALLQSGEGMGPLVVLPPTEAACAVAWVDSALMREALMAAFETLRLSGGRRPDAPYCWDRAELADALAPALAAELARRVE